MKTVLTIIMAVMTFFSAGAYRYSYTFSNTPISEAIVRISKDHPEVNISFIYKELDHYRTSVRIHTDDPYEALRSVTGISPVSVIRKDNSYYIEALQHGNYKIHGRIIDGEAEPMVAGVVY
ncbi:MAG: hypothetical protein K2J29_05405, partial [Muribaculaceae bacterium]|nr:hypothetical protein [Muribaculaceae bacterium]